MHRNYLLHMTLTPFEVNETTIGKPQLDFQMVDAGGFEPPASWLQTKHSSN
jgi:hypothetical protein|tara:strand:- start:6 stop:158 length:153 start_codon:yes stop_codon:yes gene_type:complete